MTGIDRGEMGMGRLIARVRRHVLLVVGIAALAAVGAYVYASRQTPMFSASAQLLYEPVSIVTTSYQGYVDATAQQLELQSAITVITSPDVADRAASSLTSASRPAGSSVSASVTESETSGRSSYSTGVTVTGYSPSPRWAASLANAYATAFVAWRLAKVRMEIASGEAAIESQLEQFKTAADRESAAYISLQESLNNLRVRDAMATGDYVLAVPASTPDTPYAPKPVRSAVLSLGLGLVVGLGVALLRERLDTRLHSHREVADILELPVVGRVPTISRAAFKSGPLVVLNEQDPAAHSLRTFAANLEYVSLGGEHQVIMFVSAVPGEGKTLVIANLATSLALAGRRVVLVDADLRRPQVQRLFGINGTFGASSVVTGQATIDEALVPFDPAEARVRLATGARVSSLAKSSGVLSRSSASASLAKRDSAGDQRQRAGDAFDDSPKLWLLPSGPLPPNPSAIVASRRFGAMIDQLRAMPYDYVLIDAPAVLSVGDAPAIAASVDGMMVVVNLQKMNRTLIHELKEAIAALPPAKLGVVTVADDADRGGHYGHYYGHRDGRWPQSD